MKLIYFKKNIYVVKISRKVRFSSSVIEGKKLFSIATKIEKKKKKQLHKTIQNFNKLKVTNLLFAST